MLIRTDTIAALATPEGEGGIAIVRVSGAQAADVVARVFRAACGRPPQGWSHARMYYGHVMDGDERVDEGMAVLMRAPHSYTREDVCEIQFHGGRMQVRRVLSLLLRAGARAAEPGEFTRRAFLNGRIDLSQAEAVMRLIASSSERGSREAMRQLEGGVSHFVARARAEIVSLLAGVSAAVDFPDEVDEDEAAGDLRARALSLCELLRRACDERSGRIAQEGLNVVIAGRPNVGKSSLLNALLCEERAIVTDLPGTTRDVLTESILLRGLRVNLSDTAGLRETQDVVEAIGVSRARTAMERADVLLVVLDGSQPLSGEDEALLRAPSAARKLVVLNKSDLKQAVDEARVRALCPGAQVLTLCAQRGEGVDALCERLLSFAPEDGAQTATLTQARHVQAARGACQALEDAVAAIDAGLPLDVTAVDLTRAMHILGEITGETLDEDVIDRVFATFCVGK